MGQGLQLLKDMPTPSLKGGLGMWDFDMEVGTCQQEEVLNWLSDCLPSVSPHPTLSF